MTHSQQFSSTAQAQTILHAFVAGKQAVLRSELERAARVHCKSADQGEQERCELLAEIAGQLHSAQDKADVEACWSLLRHLAGTKAPRRAVAAA